MPTIFQRLENKLDNLEKKAEKEAVKKVRNQKLDKMFYGKSKLEKIKGCIRIWSA